MKQDYNGESTAYNKKVHYFIINFKILGTCIVCMRFEFQTWNVHNNYVCCFWKHPRPAMEGVFKMSGMHPYN